MLTKDDLQAIRGIVKEEVTSTVKSEVGAIVKSEVAIQLEKGLKPINKKLNTLNKKLDLVIKTFDNEIIDHELRISRLEEKSALHSPVN